MGFNHRVIKAEDGSFNIHEVYYDEDDNIEGWTAEATSPCGTESLGELKEDIAKYHLATYKPVLIEVNGELELLKTFPKMSVEDRIKMYKDQGFKVSKTLLP